MFKTRLASGVVLVALLLVFILTGGIVLLAGLCAVSLIGMFELYRVFGMERSRPAVLGYAAGLLYYLLLFLHTAFFSVEAAGPARYSAAGWAGFIITPLFLILLLAVYVFSYPKYRIDQIMAAFFGFFYVALLLSFIFLTRDLPEGRYLVWLIFLCSWGCDTCAYCVGVLFGKHKMSPVLSPKKSVEGAFGGVIGAMLLTLIYCMMFRTQLSIDTTGVWLLAGASGIGALISMVGDLAASAIKRNYEIKDYGKLIPGHGGILDRFDSVIITAPIIFFLASALPALS